MPPAARPQNSSLLSDRVPPQALDVEKAVLGSMLIDAGTVAQGMEILDEECFY